MWFDIKGPCKGLDFFPLVSDQQVNKDLLIVISLDTVLQI